MKICRWACGHTLRDLVRNDDHVGEEEEEYQNEMGGLCQQRQVYDRPHKSGNKMKRKRKSKLYPCIYMNMYTAILRNHIFIILFSLSYSHFYLGLVYEDIRLQ